MNNYTFNYLNAHIVLENYLHHFPEEFARLKEFSEFLSRNEGLQRINRKNFDGHITASVFLYHPEQKALLLLHHKALNKWLQPGGHVDATDESILRAAFRELIEETGVQENEVQLSDTFGDDLIPFDIDSHVIPENPRKNEAQHYHHDIRFLFIYKSNQPMQLNADESLGSKWVPLKELESNRDMRTVAYKMNAFLSSKVC